MDIGSSYLPSELLAAFLYAQLEAREAIQRRRHEIWSTYRSALASWAAERQIRLPIVPDHCDHPAHLFYLLLPSLEARTALISHMKAHQILTVFHYQPLHLSDMGRGFGGAPGQCPQAEAAADRLVRLPLYFQLRDGDQVRVIEALKASLPVQ